MSLEARKISLAQKLLAIQQESLLDKIEALLKKENPALTLIQKKAIDRGLESLRNGEGLSHK